MSESLQLPEGEEQSIPKELLELGQHIATMPDSIQQELNESYNRVVEAVQRRRRILTLVQEALAQLRLDIKYLMFDLDVTKAERDQLKEQLEER